MPISNPIRSQYQPKFDQKTDEWILLVPKANVRKRKDGRWEVRLPLYLTRTYLSIGGAVLRPIRKRYREWLLTQQRGRCSECGEGADTRLGYWVLDHDPPLSKPGAKFIDYDKKTKNRVIHHACDKSQTRKAKR